MVAPGGCRSINTIFLVQLFYGSQWKDADHFQKDDDLHNKDDDDGDGGDDDDDDDGDDDGRAQTTFKRTIAINVHCAMTFTIRMVPI